MRRGNIVKSALLIANSILGTSTSSATGGLVTSFDAGGRSYAIEFTAQWGKVSNSPHQVYQNILGRCYPLGEFTECATRDTAELLVMTMTNGYGREFIFTDKIDYEDPLQECIQEVKNAYINRDFKAAKAAKAAKDMNVPQEIAAKEQKALREMAGRIANRLHRWDMYRTVRSWSAAW
jgi:putative salt-induced outer membrane protein YdiY